MLLVAAERRELAGLAVRLRRKERLRWPVGWACAGEHQGRRLVLVAGGEGRVLASAAFREAAARSRPDAVVSTGFCGALDPALRVAEVFVARAIQGAGGCYPAVEPRVSRPVRSGVLTSADRVVRSAQEKYALRARGADAVDMEAAGVAEAAGELGIPLYCIRAVIDLAGESLAIDFNAARRPDGRISMAHVVAAAFRRPVALLPELAMLARRSRLAASALGEFIADCEF